MSFLSGLFGGGKSGGLNLPNAPSVQIDPYVGKVEAGLFGEGTGLTSGNFSNLGPLMQETIQTNPQVTQLALQNLMAQLAPSYRQSKQNLSNTLEANNQLTGSTTGSSFQNLENDYLSQLTAAGAQASIADIGRALQNRVSLYGTGLNTLQATGNLALNNQEQMNNFALSNYENQVAAVLGSQPPLTGGLAGALQGAAGGAIAGGTIGGPAGAAVGGLLGGVSGYSGPTNTGGQFLSAGAGLYGSKYGQVNIPGLTQNAGAAPKQELIYSSLLAPSFARSQYLGY